MSIDKIEELITEICSMMRLEKIDKLYGHIKHKDIEKKESYKYNYSIKSATKPTSEDKK